MAGPSEDQEQTDESERASHRVRLPGFVGDEDIGLGDAVKRATSYLGIQACGGLRATAGRAQSLDGFY